MAKQKLTIDEVKKIPPTLLLRLINKMKSYIKTDPTLIDIFNKYNISIDELEFIPMKFGDIDVSAKTDHGVIIFSYRLLTDGDFFKDYSYAIHELSHYAQQTTGNKPTKGSADGNYLDNPYEIEGFQNQIEYIAHEFGEHEANKYVENLLNHHNIKDKEEKKDKKEELLAKV
jgi:hypothetical protein